jgi:hypothetical protein
MPVAGWGEAARQLIQLHGYLGRTARASGRGGAVEDARGPAVGPARRQRQVPGLFFQARDPLRQVAVELRRAASGSDE